MKADNEFITLRLHSVEQALSMVDCLFDNGYNYIHYNNEKSIKKTIKKDITTSFTNKPNSKKWFLTYYIEIDNEIKEFLIISKTIDIIDMRKEKIQTIKNKL